MAQAVYSIEQVIQAVLTLYSPVTPDEMRRQVDLFLRDFQADSSAWQIGHELLTSNSLSCDASRLDEIRFFAAQTLHTKFRMDFDQLPASLHAQMRDVALGYITLFKDSSSRMRGQIALLVAALIVQLTSWERPVEQLVTQFATDQTALMLLDVLCELPEECRSRRTVIADAARAAADAKLRAVAPQILQLLHQYLQSTGTDRSLQARVLSCLAAWAQYDFPVADLAGNPLIPLTFQALQACRYNPTQRTLRHDFTFARTNVLTTFPFFVFVFAVRFRSW